MGFDGINYPGKKKKERNKSQKRDVGPYMIQNWITPWWGVYIFVHLLPRWCVFYIICHNSVMVTCEYSHWFHPLECCRLSGNRKETPTPRNLFFFFLFLFCLFVCLCDCTVELSSCLSCGNNFLPPVCSLERFSALTVVIIITWPDVETMHWSLPSPIPLSLRCSGSLWFWSF